MKDGSVDFDSAGDVDIANLERPYKAIAIIHEDLLERGFGKFLPINK
jgi:hypothetical protein